MGHEYYMHRCLQLAKNGKETVSPNPRVGSVVVHNNTIIAEGWHRKAGEPHAEVLAIGAVADQSLLSTSTLYVNLEPCAHHGRTPPCSDLIIEKQIPRVVIGSRDPFSEVNGKGIAKLKKAGTDVIEGVLQQECLHLNRRFFTFHQKKRPYVILKWAQSADGFMDRERSADQKGPNWITGKESKILVHSWRAEEDAILIGAQTALNDQPALTVREVSGKNPIRLVIDPQLRVNPNLTVLDETSENLVFNYKTATKERSTEWVKLDESTAALQQILQECYRRNIQSMMVEGGARTLQRFIEAGYWDEARVFTGTPNFGKGLKAPLLQGHYQAQSQWGADTLQVIYNL